MLWKKVKQFHEYSFFKKPLPQMSFFPSYKKHQNYIG